MAEIGIIGVGNAGGPLARRLISKGHSLRIYDRMEAAIDPLEQLGARRAARAADAVADVTLVVLPGPLQVAEAMFDDGGIAEALGPANILIDLSGTDPASVEELGTAARERGSAFVSCTLHAAGAPAQTIPAGTLSIVAGGERPVLERALPILQDLAMTVVCVPDTALPKVMKIGIIMLAVINHIAAAELAAWLDRQGKDPAIMLQVMRETDSSTPSGYLQRILGGGLKAGGNIRNTHKDLELALRIAGELTLPLPLTSLAEQILQMGRARGAEQKDLPEAMSDLYGAIAGGSLPRVEGLTPGDGPIEHEPRVLWLGWS